MVKKQGETARRITVLKKQGELNCGKEARRITVVKKQGELLW